MSAGKWTPPERWGWRIVQDNDSPAHPIVAMLLERVGLEPPSDPCIFAVREDWFRFLDRTDEGQRRLALVKNAPALADEAGLIESPDEAAGCVPCLRCGGFRAPGDPCGCGGGVLWAEAKRLRESHAALVAALEAFEKFRYLERTAPSRNIAEDYEALCEMMRAALAIARKDVTP